MSDKESCFRFKKLDVFGKYFTFEHEDNKQFKTFSGSCFTIILFFSLCYLGILFGKEVWERENPVSSTSLDYIPNSIINMIEIPIMVSMFNFYNS